MASSSLWSLKASSLERSAPLPPPAEAPPAAPGLRPAPHAALPSRRCAAPRLRAMMAGAAAGGGAGEQVATLAPPAGSAPRSSQKPLAGHAACPASSECSATPSAGEHRRPAPPAAGSQSQTRRGTSSDSRKRKAEGGQGLTALRQRLRPGRRVLGPRRLGEVTGVGELGPHHPRPHIQPPQPRRWARRLHAGRRWRRIRPCRCRRGSLLCLSHHLAGSRLGARRRPCQCGSHRRGGLLLAAGARRRRCRCGLCALGRGGCPAGADRRLRGVLPRRGAADDSRRGGRPPLPPLQRWGGCEAAKPAQKFGCGSVGTEAPEGAAC